MSDDESSDYINKTFPDLKIENKLFVNSTFSFRTTNSEEVLQLLNKIDSSSAAGNGDISTKILKSCASIIAPSLAKMFNSCISSLSITNSWKFAIITPLFKGKGQIDECDNYRGISVLQQIVKLFERILAKQITHYFDSEALFCDQQHGFRSGRSCESALQTILDGWKSSIAEKKVVLSMFVDFKKAFDLIDPKLLF